MPAIPLRDRKLLWSRSGNICAFEGCNRGLIIEVEQSGRAAVVSQECHIVAEREDGPRGRSPLSTAERNSYLNLILLCLEHHKVIDDDPETWTVDRVLRMKADHERWFESLRSPEDERRAALELILVDLIEEWASRVNLDEWRSWASALLGVRPRFRKTTMDLLDETRIWLFSHPWPSLYPTLTKAIENFQCVADDLFIAADSSLEENPETRDRELVPLHKRRWLGSQEEYDRSAAETEWVTDLIQDLVFELTRSANWVLDEIRANIDPRYRVGAGVLILQRPEGLGSRYYRPEYREDEVAAGKPYLGLRAFVDERVGRSSCFGQGFSEDGWRAVNPCVLD
jgi:hypothetical protein